MTHEEKIHEILTSADVVNEIYNNLDYLIEIIPEINFMIDFPQNNPHHHLDVFKHTMLALKKSPNNFEIRLCLLFHDIGKPFSYHDVGEVRHFRGHQLVSSNMTKMILHRFNYSEEFINEVCYLIKKHDEPIRKSEIEHDTILSYKRYLIQECDALAHHPDKLEKRKEYLTRIRKLIKNTD